MEISTPIRLEPGTPNLAEELAAFSGRSGIYLLAFTGAPPHLSWSTNLERRLKRLLLTRADASKAGSTVLRDRVAAVNCWITGSRLETSLLLYELAKALYPQRYLQYLKLRLPWFVGLSADDAFPRLQISQKKIAVWGSLFGPFISRTAAQQYEEELLALFQTRRCTETLAPHPEHPGCIYGEMNQCLRPCQCAVTTAEYGTEAGRLEQFLQSNGKSALAALSSARDRACEETDFEQAAQIHKRLEKIKTAASLRDPVIGEIHRFNGAALTRSPNQGEFLLWPMLAGVWQDPLALDFLGEKVRTKSLDAEIRERLVAHLSHKQTEGDPLEQLALFSRWYYSSWRDGAWFPFTEPGRLNYRKLVRELSK